MTTQHTPGPWNLAFGKQDAVIYTEGTIAEVNDTMSDWKVNARLIAAAPELLAALQNLIEQADDPDNEAADELVSQIDWHGIRAAIAKATNS